MDEELIRRLVITSIISAAAAVAASVVSVLIDYQLSKRGIEVE